jgi:hypothetical protein
MVRRWSYINHINTTFLRSSKMYAVEASAKDAILNVIMYLRCDFPFASKSFRKNWTRRKYANQRLFLTNVMINWAKEYRFYKNYNRMLHHQFLFKNTYLSINLIINKSYTSERTKYDVAVIGSSITRRIMDFFTKRFFDTRFSNLMYWPNTSWSYASYITPFDEDNNTHLNAPYTPLYYIPFKENVYTPLIYQNLLMNRLDVLRNVNNLVLKWVQSIVTTYYNSMVKILWFVLFKPIL